MSPIQNAIQTNKERCWTCNRKVGLTGIQCKCSYVFCAIHRYSDKHNCTYDYKAEGRAKITKENPVITPEKLSKL